MTERVLLIRSCRTSRFIEALAALRARYPGAEVWALCHVPFRQELLTAGVDDVLTYPGGRFTLTRTPPALLKRIRGMNFDAVAVPYMEPDHICHANVHRLCLAFGSKEVAILPDHDRVEVIDAPRFRRFAARTTRQALLRALDVPFLLILMFAAQFVPRRRRREDERERPTRILHVITSLAAGGAQLQLAELLARMPRDRYQCDVLVLNRHDGSFSLPRFTTNHRIEYLDSWPDLCRSLWRIIQLCRRERYDIVHTWLFYANFLGAAAARFARTPRIISSVRNLSLWKRTWYYKPWFRAADMLGSRLADIVTVNGESLVDDHARWAKCAADGIHVVPNGLDPAALAPLADNGARERLREQLGLSAQAIVIGTAGRLAPEKDQATFLQILKRLHADRPDVRAVIVGGGDQRPRLEALARTLALDGVVTFLGERDDARRVIAGLDLFLLTSQCEGFPNVLLEAAFLGVPSIATDVGASRDVLISGDALFPVRDVIAGYRLVKRALDDPARLKARADATRERALRRFTADQMAAAWMRLYEPQPRPMATALPASERARREPRTERTVLTEIS